MFLVQFHTENDAVNACMLTNLHYKEEWVFLNMKYDLIRTAKEEVRYKDRMEPKSLKGTISCNEETFFDNNNSSDYVDKENTSTSNTLDNDFLSEYALAFVTC